MAKKKMGRPKSDRDDVSVKIDRTVAFQLKQVAGHKGVYLAELLTDITKGTAAKMYLEMLKKVGDKP